MHIATTPTQISGWCIEDVTNFAGEEMTHPQSLAQILAAHDEGVNTVKERLTKVGDEGMKQMWTATAGGATLMQMPKGALVRAIVLNHWIHHRGQLSVYLRLLDIAVPSIYGPSADENPFRPAAG
jgi:uncharacterized damage-inducible protein DinB